MPGSEANIDHVVVTGTAVFVIDTKNYRGRLTLVGSNLWHGAFPPTNALESVCSQAVTVGRLLAGPRGVPVRPVICVVGASLPRPRLGLRGVTVVEDVAELTSLLMGRGPRVLAEAEIERLRRALERVPARV